MCRARIASRRHKSFPVFRSSASVISLSPSVAVRKMRSAVITGDDRAKGTGVFQARLLVELNSAGSAKPSAMPVPFGPRNCSHSLVRLPCCPYNVDAALTNNAISRRERFMFLSCFGAIERTSFLGKGFRFWLILAQSLEVRNNHASALHCSAVKRRNDYESAGTG